jgi:SNW domain-containing protein 1
MRGRFTDEYFRARCREQNRDISEKIALGLAKPTTSKESMYDSRLFNREANQASMGDSGSYNVYDKPLFNAQNAAAAIYRPRGNNRNDEAFGGGTEEGISNALENDRFGLGASKFVGAAEAGKEDRSGPVEFEKDVSLNMGQVQGMEGQQDPFGLNQFMGDAVAGKKRGLDTSG